MNNKYPLPFAAGKGEKREGFFIDDQLGVAGRRLENRDGKWAMI